MCAQSLSCVRLFVTPWTVACQATLMVKFQAIILAWLAISHSRESSPLRDQTSLPAQHLGSSNPNYLLIYIHMHKISKNIRKVFCSCVFFFFGFFKMWIIFKMLMEFVSISLLFYVLVFLASRQVGSYFPDRGALPLLNWKAKS